MLDRCAVFVDAGYLWACASERLGTTSRAPLSCDHGALVDALRERATAASQLPLLRVYWYDGAPQSTPTPEQRRVAALDHVKLRMGRLTHGKQKGVDSLIHRDLVTLARNRAIDAAFLLSGDDDLTEAVDSAQEHGVVVTSWGVALPEGAHQSAHLRATCDRVELLPVELLDATFAVAAEPASPDAVGADTARTISAGLSAGELAALRAERPRIPAAVDGQLLAALASAVPGYDESAKRQARAAFWAALA